MPTTDIASVPRSLSRRGFLTGSLSLAVLAGLAACTDGSRTASSPSPGLHAGDGRYLLDKSGKPVFLVADTAWNLMSGVRVEDAKRYLDIRKEQGFNTVMSNLVRFNRTEATIRGTAFQDGNVSTPNEEWFAGCDEILDHAHSIGLNMGLGVLWLADNGGRVGGTLPPDAELNEYCRFIGERYKGRDNIFYWVGGDDEPEASAPAAKKMGEALAAADPDALITFHTWNKAPMATEWPWLGFYSYQWNSNSAPYEYMDIKQHFDEYRPRKPVFPIEPPYEPNACCGDDKDTDARENRRAGWWAALSGALGIVYGGPRNTWNVGADTDGALVVEDLRRPQAEQTAFIGKVIQELDWSLLEPDFDKAVLPEGRGTWGQNDYAMAARLSDGSAIIAYTPVKRDLIVNLEHLSGPAMAHWIDPATMQDASSPEPVDPGGQRTFTNPLPQDAVLLIEID